MPEFILDFFPLLIGLVAISIPLTAIVGRTIVGPIVKELGRLREAQGRPGASTELAERVALLERRLDELEIDLAPSLEKQEFDRQLQAGRARPGDR